MARYDKYDPIAGGFRAALLADMAKTSAGNPKGVGLDNAGKVTPAAGNTGIVGVVCLTKDMKAGDIVDVMTNGEVVEFTGVAGTLYYAAAADGVISTTNTGKLIGFTVEATRLVVRV